MVIYKMQEKLASNETTYILYYIHYATLHLIRFTETSQVFYKQIR